MSNDGTIVYQDPPFVKFELPRDSHFARLYQALKELTGRLPVTHRSVRLATRRLNIEQRRIASAHNLELDDCIAMFLLADE